MSMCSTERQTSMLKTLQEPRRQTTADEIFHRLRDDVICMRLLPGRKLSEVEIAKQFDVSRQPVREAFMRLGELNLLQIRPQKATLVRKISLQGLRNTRFIRAAVEVEVVRQACLVRTDEGLSLLRQNLEAQSKAVSSVDAPSLKTLDYEFHRLICAAAGCLPAFETIAENKTHTDRVCTLELADADAMAEVLEGHTDIVEAIKSRDEDLAVERTRHHLAHLDATLTVASQNHPEFFEE